MKLGTDDPKKVVFLGALIVLGGYVGWSNLSSTPASTPAAPATATSARQSPLPAEAPEPARPAARNARSRVQTDDFHPALHPKRPEDRIDPAKVDPTLRLDLLAKVQAEDHTGPGRNVFLFGAQPQAAEPKVIPAAVAPVKVEPTPPAPPAAPPPPPPILLKYYGFSSAPGSTARTAFFLDGEEILVAKEGEMVKRRYRVVRVGATSAVLEDTESKRQQTIQLAEEASAG